MRKKLKSLIISLIIVFFINLVLNCYLLFSIYSMKERYSDILNNYVQMEDKMSMLSEGIYRMQSFTLSVMITNDDVSRSEYIAEIDQLEEKNMEILEYLGKNLRSTEAEEIFYCLYTDYLYFSSERAAVIDIGSSEAAHYYVNTILELKMKDMNESLKKLDEIVVDNIVEAKEDIDTSNVINRTLITIVVTVSLLGMISLIAYFIKYSGKLMDTFDNEKRNHQKAIIAMQQKTITDLAELVESRDGDTGTHVKNTATYVEMIAKQLAKESKYKSHMTNEYISLLKRFAPLHDVGKIVVSDTILLKPGKLTPEEFEIMKTHTVEGGKIVNSILNEIEPEENVQIARNIARHHHEKWNGKGYPDNLSEEDIPLCARIMSVADVFDALISKRCYKDSFSLEDAYKIINDEKGQQFDPEVVDAFMAIRTEIEEYLNIKENNN